MRIRLHVDCANDSGLSKKSKERSKKDGRGTLPKLLKDKKTSGEPVLKGEMKRRGSIRGRKAEFPPIGVCFGGGEK